MATRRVVVLGLLTLAALAVAALAIAVIANGGSGAPQQTTALPLHPVAGDFEPDDTTLLQCSAATCFEQAFGNIAYREGPKAALALFDDRIASSEDNSECHRIAHAIGAASLARYRGNVARTFAAGSSSCFSGYYHGVLERSLSQVKSYKPDSLATVARGLCEELRGRAVAWPGYHCLHGLGHGLMITTGYSLPLSIKVCNRLGKDWDRTACKSGAFMENLSSSYGVQSRWIRDDDPIYPCNWVAKGDKLKCYEIVTSRILPMVDWDWDKTAQMCARVEKGWASACFRSLGRDAAGTTKFDPSETLEHCASARPHGGEGSCIAGAALATTGAYTSAKRASILCATSPVALRGGCYYAIGAVVRNFSATVAEREADCRAITTNPGHIARCVSGTKVSRPQTLDF